MTTKIKIALATESNRNDIDHIRHEVYAKELQHLKTAP